MGLPVMNVIFSAAAQDSIRRSDRSIVGMIIKDATVPENNPVTIYKKKDIPSTLTAANQEQIKFALQGYVNAPSKIVVYVLGSAAEDYEDALEYFSLYRVTWLCCPTVKTDTQTDAVIAWVKEQRGRRNKVKAVLPEANTANCEGIVNYATTSVTIGRTIDERGIVGIGKAGSTKVGDATYTAEQYCSRIAGILAGTPQKYSVTYAVLDEVAPFKNPSDEELDEAIDAGKFMLYYDGEKVKVARAVNSLTTITEGKAEPWKKIKVVETMDMIHDDLVLLAEDNYIGKYVNSYDNKCLLLSAIKSYFDEIGRSGLIQDYTVDFDVDAIRDYIVENKGVSREDAEAMKDADVKKQYTDEKVFMAATITVVDVMEDITLQITV